MKHLQGLVSIGKVFHQSGGLLCNVAEANGVIISMYVPTFPRVLSFILFFGRLYNKIYKIRMNLDREDTSVRNISLL